MTQSILNHYWSARAAAYHSTHMESAQAATEKELWARAFTAALADLPPGAHVADMGCGTGFLSAILAEQGFAVTGIDASPGMLAHARGLGLPSATFTEGDATAPVLTEADGVTAVVSRWLLWTLPDPVRALRRWADIVRPSDSSALPGLIVVADGLWYPDGIDSSMEVDSTQGPDAFARTYDGELTAHLPLSQRVSLEDYREVFRAAGLVPEVTELPETRELDARFGLAAGHDSAVQFLISARVGGTRGASEEKR